VYRVKDLLVDYVTSWFPTAINTSRVLKARGGVEQFRWTSHAWLVEALLRNDSGVTTPAFDALLREAIAQDEVNWHGNPMNMQGEVGERYNMV